MQTLLNFIYIYIHIWFTKYSFRRNHDCLFQPSISINRTSFGFTVALFNKHCAICLSYSLHLSLCPFPHCQKLRTGLPGSPQHLRLSHPSVLGISIFFNLHRQKDPHRGYSNVRNSNWRQSTLLLLFLTYGFLLTFAKKLTFHHSF